MTDQKPKLTLGFHGRIIDHLGIQMYQSPTAAIAEVVSNAWDADADDVKIKFDFTSSEKSDWTIEITDNGNGMTLKECQSRFLSVGYNRRESKGPTEKSKEKSRPVMGRKGIGKFAGFGIARYIGIKTVSRETTEVTEFELDIQSIRKGDSYVSTTELEIAVKNHSEKTILPHGTVITLRDLKIGKRIQDAQFSDSLARRFAINSVADQFQISLNGNPVIESIDATGIEMSFPRDLPEADKKERNIEIDTDGLGKEKLPNGKEVSWKINFYKELVKNEEIAGVTVFAHKKLAQRPFMFNLTGGMASQAGPEYMSGKVIADWVDELGEDVISTERQRLNWEHPELSEMQEWGQALIRRLLSIWKSKRTEKKMQALESKMDSFSSRIGALGSEGKVVKGALTKLAQIEKLTTEQFTDMGHAVLLAWEQGRLKELINQIANSAELDETGLLELLTEANAITALHTAETVKTKLLAIEGLQKRIDEQQLENAVRDYIAKNPWLISPRWETFAKEMTVDKICQKAASSTLDKDEAFNGRVDLVLSSDKQLLLLEFMRPGLPLDRDHLNRFNEYIDIIHEKITADTALGFDHISGYLIADKLEDKTGMSKAIKDMKQNERYAMSWPTLIAQARKQWIEFLDHIKLRAPEDQRVQAIHVNDKTVEDKANNK
ncbi:ATP-binding protein [bacterium]|nr:ATP-binding protein [bacterium]